MQKYVLTKLALKEYFDSLSSVEDVKKAKMTIVVMPAPKDFNNEEYNIADYKISSFRQKIITRLITPY